MVVIAVAGGTGALGRAIVEALITQKKHKILILSRKADAAKERKTGTRFIATDLNDVAALAKMLEDNNVHTVISTLSMMPDAAGLLEQNLIQAAEISKTTKRFIPSEFGFPQREEDGHIFPSISTKQASQRALQASGLEWTMVYNGYLMDYFAMPQLKSYLTLWVVLLDIPGNAAAIPGDGNKPITFTHTSDVGRFVAGLMNFEKWNHISVIIGDKMTLNEAVKIAEEAKGTKFKVDYDDLDKLKMGQVTELPSQIALYSSVPKQFVQAINSRFGIWVDRGDFDFDENTSLNTILPDIKPIKLKELVEKAWKN